MLLHEGFYEDYELKIYKFLYKEGFHESMLSYDKLSVLNRIHEKFKNYTGKMLSDYMHKERTFVLIRDATKSRGRQAAKPQRITAAGKRSADLSRRSAKREGGSHKRSPRVMNHLETKPR